MYKILKDKKSHESWVPVSEQDSRPVVAAALHQRGFIPGIYSLQEDKCFIPWGCKGHQKPKFYVLCVPEGMELEWVKNANGHVPKEALIGGIAETGEVLYIGRYKRFGITLGGKIHPSHKVCYAPYQGGEHASTKYEVLCLKDSKGFDLERFREDIFNKINSGGCFQAILSDHGIKVERGQKRSRNSGKCGTSSLYGAHHLNYPKPQWIREKRTGRLQRN